MRNIDQIKRDMCLCVGEVIADKGWSAVEASKKLGIATCNIYHIRNVEPEYISVTMLVRAMNALGYTASLTITRGV
ncbi:MAG: XRE family transcriptional regulator [Plesiomonas sp.]